MRLAGLTRRNWPTPSVSSARAVERAGDAQARDVALALADGEHVEQALRRVRDVRLAGVEHAHVRRDVARDVRRQPRLGVAHDEDIDLHGLQRVEGVEHRLALHPRRGLHVEVHDVGAEPLGGELEGDARARAWLEEQVRDRAPPQALVAGRQLAGHAHVELREVEQVVEFLAAQPVEGEQVAQAPGLVALQLVARVIGQGGLPGRS